MENPEMGERGVQGRFIVYLLIGVFIFGIVMGTIFVYWSWDDITTEDDATATPNIVVTEEIFG